MKQIKKKQRIHYKRFIPLYVMMLPGMIYIIINNYIPMFGLSIAFQRFNYAKGIFGSKFIGLKNFEFLFKSQDAWIITRNTLCYNAAFIVLGTALGIAVSILLYEITSSSLRKLYQTVMLTPFLISMIIVSYLAYAFLHADTGFINNSILKPLGLQPVTWYLAPKYWPFILIIINLWHGFGYTSILYYSTLVGIDRSYFEAADIDGASRWQKITSITLPCMTPTITILTLMSIGKILYSDFGLFYQVPMNNGTLLNVTNTIDTYVYRGLTTMNNPGMVSAAGFYQSIVGFVLVFTANYIVNKIDSENALF